MSIRLGMPTLIELPGIDETARVCRDLGLSLVELNMNMPAFCPESLEPGVVRRLAQETGIEFTLHLPEEVDLASIHPPMRGGCLQRCREAIAWAGEAGIGLASIHLNSGVYFTLTDRKVWVYEHWEEQFRANLMESFGELLDLARRSGVVLALENTGDFGRTHIAASIRRLAALEGFSLTWDVGHDAASGHSDRPLLMEYQDRIVHMHLHDCRGRANHLVPFTGDVDIAGMLDFARQRGIGVVIEVKTLEALRESVTRIVPLLEDWA